MGLKSLGTIQVIGKVIHLTVLLQLTTLYIYIYIYITNFEDTNLIQIPTTKYQFFSVKFKIQSLFG